MGDINTEIIQIHTKGLKSSLDNTPIEDGKLRFTLDTRELFLDEVKEDKSSRIKISDIEDSFTEEEIFEILAPLPKIYLAKDTHRAYVSSGLDWVDLGAINLSLSDIKDVDLPLWFSSAEDDKPYYNSDLTYNTATKELKSSNIVAKNSMKVGNMVVTDTLNEDSTHLVEFSFTS